MKKKLLFTAYSLGLGGIETALVNLLNNIDYKKYDVTLILEKKEGIFLQDLPKEVHVLEYKISNNKIVILRKIYNRIKLIKWQLKLKNKFDFSCCFATYSIPGAHLSLKASSNNYLWVHNNYYVLYNRDENKMKEFFDTVFAEKFKHLVFVSNENKEEVCSHYKELEEKAFECNNFIDGDSILKKSKEKIDYNNKRCTFVNVGRHDEDQKRLSRIIEASSKLKKDGYLFDVVLVGDGSDSVYYKELIEKYDLNDYIHMIGRKKNPYPYYKMADAVILSSEYEGFPVVFLEAMILNKPILSTKVSDWEEYNNVNGVFVDKNIESIYEMMKSFLDNGFQIKKKFDYKKYNTDIMNKIEKMIG